MANFKKKAKIFAKNTKECFIHSLIPAFMYLAMSGVLLVILQKNTDGEGNTSATATWVASIICGLIAVAYNAVMAWACGGTHFEQLISGNMKRRSAEEFGCEYAISSYKSEKEYRPWKGFVTGCFTALPVLIGGLIFGAYQERLIAQTTSRAASVVLLIFYFLAGWAVLPFERLNAPYYGLSAILAVIPVIATGVFYIAGAYRKRSNIMKKQALADRRSAEQEAKPKKINYGGLPGTKPKKKK